MNYGWAGQETGDSRGQSETGVETFLDLEDRIKLQPSDKSMRNVSSQNVQIQLLFSDRLIVLVRGAAVDQRPVSHNPYRPQVRVPAASGKTHSLKLRAEPFVRRSLAERSSGKKNKKKLWFLVQLEGLENAPGPIPERSSLLDISGRVLHWDGFLRVIQPSFNFLSFVFQTLWFFFPVNLQFREN